MDREITGGPICQYLNMYYNTYLPTYICLPKIPKLCLSLQTLLAMAGPDRDRKNTTIQNVTAKIQEKFRAVTGFGESSGLRSEPKSQTHSQLQLDTML